MTDSRDGTASPESRDRDSPKTSGPNNYIDDLSSKPLAVSSVLCQVRSLWVVLVELQSEVSSWRQLERV
ncbi:hypothetical protein Bca4012_043685 [Brassica carinata]